MPELKDLSAIVLSLVLVGFIIAVAVIIQSRTYTGFADTETANESVTTVLDTKVALTNTWVQSIISITNGTVNDCTNYTTELKQETSYIRIGSNGTTVPNGCVGTFDIVLTHKDVANSEASTATASVLSATKEIATSWLGLIITVMVLSIILGLVIGSFGMGRR